MPTQYQMSDHPLRVLIGVTFCWVENYVNFDSVVIIEYFLEDHCHLQKEKKKKKNLKFPRYFPGGANLFIKDYVSPIRLFNLIPP